jgi:hypothetical protein
MFITSLEAARCNAFTVMEIQKTRSTALLKKSYLPRLRTFDVKFNILFTSIGQRGNVYELHVISYEH